jgi:hypothetical protein
VEDIAWTNMEPAAQRRRNRDPTLVGNDRLHPCHNAYRLLRLIASNHERRCVYGFGSAGEANPVRVQAKGTASDVTVSRESVCLGRRSEKGKHA